MEGAWDGPRVSVVTAERDVGRMLAGLPHGIFEVVLVEAGSSDGTVTAAREQRPDVRIVRQTGNTERDALAAGLAASRGDAVVMVSGGGTTDPTAIARFVDALVKGADFAPGARFADGGGGSSHIGVARWAGSRAAAQPLLACAGSAAGTFTSLRGYPRPARDVLRGVLAIFRTR
jgi:glycosyltransferase involved in cell wall biosynthesis